MKKILLCCAAGMSTSLLVKKIKEAAEAEGYECEVSAEPFAIGSPNFVKSDCVLLGPQVRFNLKNLQERYPEIPSDVIDMRAYGMCDGKKILAQAKQLLGE